MGFFARFRTPKPRLQLFELKFVFKPKYCDTCGQETNRNERHLKVLAAHEEDAILMRRFLMNEGFEG